MAIHCSRLGRLGLISRICVFFAFCNRPEVEKKLTSLCACNFYVIFAMAACNISFFVRIIFIYKYTCLIACLCV